MSELGTDFRSRAIAWVTAHVRPETQSGHELLAFMAGTEQEQELRAENAQLRATNARLTAQCDEWMGVSIKAIAESKQMSDLFQKIRDRLVPASSQEENHGGESTGEQAWPPPPLLEIIDRMKAREARLTAGIEAVAKAFKVYFDGSENRGVQIEVLKQLDLACAAKSSSASEDLACIREAVKNLEVIKSEAHQPMVALKPWIDGDPDRSHLDLAHLSACSFRAWGAAISALAALRERFGGSDAK